MTPHHVKVVQLTEDYARLTRDDRQRYEQLLWAMQGEQRRLPGEVGFRVPLAMMLLGGGQRERALEHVNVCLAELRTGTMLSFLVTILIGHLTALGMFEDARTLLLAQLRTRLPDAELARVHHRALDLGMRSGSVELLHRCAQAGVGPAAHARQILDRLGQADLLEWLGKQQRALEAILGPVTTGFTLSLLVAESGAPRIVLTYYTSAPAQNLRKLGERVFAALHDVYETHPRGPAAYLGHFIVDVRGPLIAEHEPADRARSAITDGLGTQTLWREVRRFAHGHAIDPGLRRNWTVSRAFMAAVHHLMAAAPAAGIDMRGDGGPYEQLIRGIAGSLNRQWRAHGLTLERLRCAALVADYSPGQFASATDVAEILDLAATVLGDAIDEAPPAPQPATGPAPGPVDVAAEPAKSSAPTPSASPAEPPASDATIAAMLLKLDEKVVLDLLEQQLVTLNANNPELERALRRVFRLAREGDAGGKRDRKSPRK